MIRNAKMTDVEEMTKLCLQLDYPVTKEQVEFRLERLINDKDNGVFVYEDVEGAISGWIHVFGKYLIELVYAEIGGLVVDSNARRQGIGRELMKKCEQWAKENGYEEIRLRSGGQRKGAHEFYRRIGYENINRQEVFRTTL